MLGFVLAAGVAYAIALSLYPAFRLQSRWGP